MHSKTVTYARLHHWHVSNKPCEVICLMFSKNSNISGVGGISKGKGEGSRESRGTRKCSHPERKWFSLLCCQGNSQRPKAVMGTLRPNGESFLFPINDGYCWLFTVVFKTFGHAFSYSSLQIIQRKGNLRLVLEQWTLYRRASEEINGYLMEGRYSVSRLRLLNGSLEAVQQQVESLEVRITKAGFKVLFIALNATKNNSKMIFFLFLGFTGRDG